MHGQGLVLTGGERSLLQAAAAARATQFRLLRVEYGYITDLPRKASLGSGEQLEQAVRGLLQKQYVREVDKGAHHWRFAVTADGAAALRQMH